MIRKKWFGWGLLILLALGIIVFWMGGVLKTNLVEVEKKTGGELERVVAVEAGKEQELKQIMGIVDNWDAKSGKLVFMEDKIRHEVLVDPGNMRVMVNSLKVKGRDLMVTENNGLRWEKAIRLSLREREFFILFPIHRVC